MIRHDGEMCLPDRIDLLAFRCLMFVDAACAIDPPPTYMTIAKMILRQTIMTAPPIKY